jgi:transposase-like protein
MLAKGLENVIKDVFPHAKQRECFRHMMQNYVKRFSRGAEHMYPSARAYRKVVYDHHCNIPLSNSM